MDAMTQVERLARQAQRLGGHALIVGGWVRDRALGVDSKDIDVEVLGISTEQLEAMLAELGTVDAVGQSFGVLRVKGLDVDFSIPRTDTHTGVGHKGFDVSTDPNMSFADACLRRDLTVNAMGFDPLTNEVIDPHNGMRHLQARLLRPTDASRFGEDPLRVLRAAQFSARFNMKPTDELIDICRDVVTEGGLKTLSAERIFGEFEKLLLKAERPSVGLEFLDTVGALAEFDVLAALKLCPQDAVWHPEGDVWTHTLMVVDQAAKLRTGDAESDRALLWGALCHDLGKPPTTVVDDDSRVRSRGHDDAGVDIAEQFLTGLAAPNDLIDAVKALVKFHLTPATFVAQGSGAGAFRRLARKLGSSGVSMTLLERLARADQLGRTTPAALAGDFVGGDEFLVLAENAGVQHSAPVDVVMGRHLIERGLRPGPEFGTLLARCREIQFETGLVDASEILKRVGL